MHCPDTSHFIISNLDPFEKLLPFPTSGGGDLVLTGPWEAEERGVGMVGSHIFDNNIDLTLLEKWVFWWFGGFVGDIVEDGRLRCFTRSVGQSELHQFPDWSLNLPDSSASIAPKSSNRWNPFLFLTKSMIKIRLHWNGAVLRLEIRTFPEQAKMWENEFTSNEMEVRKCCWHVGIDPFWKKGIEIETSFKRWWLLCSNNMRQD